MYVQIVNPIAHSIGASATFALLPLLCLFILLGVLRMQARSAALASLVVCLFVAVFVYRMPVGQALSGALEGAATGFFPIIWIGINAIWLFKLTQASGHDDVLRRTLARVSTDQRVQAVLIAFCFGALLEALAGGGAPVAICAVLLISIGVEPMKAAAVCLIADTSPVAFGALGLPLTVLSKVTGLPLHDLSVMVGRQAPLLSLFIPMILIFLIDGRRGLKEMWPLALVAGISFAVAQCAGSMLLPVELVDIVAALICAAMTIAFVRIFSIGGVLSATASCPRDSGRTSASFALPPGATLVASRPQEHRLPGPDSDDASAAIPKDSTAQVLRALAPYGAVILVVALAQIGFIGHALGAVTSSFAWPGLHVVNSRGAPIPAVQAKFEWLLSAGSIVLIAGIFSVPVLGLRSSVAVRTYLRNLHELRWAVFTVCCVVGIAYVMNLSGQIVTLGIWAANAGAAFALVSPILGWFATALTGSDTSANALFGVLQLTTAQHTGLSGVLLAAANTSGGVVGKAISPQNLAVGAVAVGLMGREGLLFRQVIGWTIVMIAALSLLVYLQSTPVLNWMVP